VFSRSAALTVALSFAGALACDAREQHLGLAVSETGTSPDGSVRAAPSVRALTPLARQLVREGQAASATFRALVDELGGTDLVVLVQTGRWEPAEGRCHANLRLLNAGPNARIVRIWVDAWWQSRLDQVALLTHELRHAVEIGRAPDARDAARVTALFRRIGRESHDRGYETRAARNVEAVVAAELASAPALARRR